MHKTHFSIYAYRTESRYRAFYWRHCNVTNVTLTSLKCVLTSFCYASACNLWATFPRAGTYPNTTACDARRRLPGDSAMSPSPPRRSGHLARRRSRHGRGGRRRRLLTKAARRRRRWRVSESAAGICISMNLPDDGLAK